MPEEEREDRITMVDDQGHEHDFVVLDVIDLHDRTYALLTPAESEGDEEGEVVIMRIENDTLVNIEDEEEFNHVVSHLEGHAHE